MNKLKDIKDNTKEKFKVFFIDSKKMISSRLIIEIMKKMKIIQKSKVL